MKTRKSFVTNSSSSSFIVAVKNETDTSFSVAELNLIDKYVKKITTIEELEKETFEQCYGGDCENLIEVFIYEGWNFYQEYKKQEQYLKDGFEIWTSCIDRDYEESNMISKMYQREGIVILEEDWDA